MAFDKKFNPDELKQFLKSKYGPGVQVEIFPKAEEDPTDEGGDKAERRSRALRFDYKPSQIKEYLDRYVIEQVDAKKVLATAVCDHYHHIQGCQGEEDCQDYKKQNIILIGPTGVGKTYLIQNIARLIGVPFEGGCDQIQRDRLRRRRRGGLDSRVGASGWRGYPVGGVWDRLSG